MHHAMARKLGILSRLGHFLHVNFFAGMFIALPLAITVAALVWVWGKLVGPLQSVFGFTEKVGGPWEGIKEAVEGSQYEKLLPPLLGMCILLVAVLLLGILIRSILGRWLLGFFEHLVAHVPLVGLLYASVKQLGEAFISEDGKSKFHSAVLVQFPMKGSWVIGFVTGVAYAPLAKAMSETLKEHAKEKGQELPEILTVFVPTTPLPTQGFTLVLPKSETRPLDISVEEAIKLVISGGIVSAPGASARQSPQPLERPETQKSARKSGHPQEV